MGNIWKYKNPNLAKLKPVDPNILKPTWKVVGLKELSYHLT